MNQPQKLCPRCQAPAPLDAPICQRVGCGHQFRTDFSEPHRTQLAFSAQQMWQQPAASPSGPPLSAARQEGNPLAYVSFFLGAPAFAAVFSRLFGLLPEGWITPAVVIGGVSAVMGTLAVRRLLRFPYCGGVWAASLGIICGSMAPITAAIMLYFDVVRAASLMTR